MGENSCVVQVVACDVSVAWAGFLDSPAGEGTRRAEKRREESVAERTSLSRGYNLENNVLSGGMH